MPSDDDWIEVILEDWDKYCDFFTGLCNEEILTWLNSHAKNEWKLFEAIVKKQVIVAEFLGGERRPEEIKLDFFVRGIKFKDKDTALLFKLTF